MGKLTNFDEIRKKRQKKTLFFRLLILAVISAGIISAYTYRDTILSMGIGNWASDGISAAFGGSGYPVFLPGDEPNWSGRVGGWLAIKDNTSLYLYTSSGRMLTEKRLHYQNPIVRVTGDRILSFDRGSYGLSVDYGGRQLFNKTFDNQIHCADLSTSGVLAVSTGATGYLSQVTVYSKEFEEILKYSSENFITGLSISPRKGMLAASTVTSKGGMLSSGVHLLNFTSSTELTHLDLDDQLILSIEYKKDGYVHIITDRSVILMTETGEIHASFDFGGKSLAAFDTNHDNYDIIILETYQNGKKLEIISLDGTLAAAGRCEMSSEVTGLQTTSKRLYISSSGRTEAYDLQLKPIKTYETPDAITATVVGNTLYYATPREIQSMPIS